MVKIAIGTRMTFSNNSSSTVHDIEKSNKNQKSTDLYKFCLDLYNKLEHQQAIVSDVLFLVNRWHIESERLRDFNEYIASEAETPSELNRPPKEIIQRLISYLANIVFNLTTDEINGLTTRSMANILKMYVYLTERLINGIDTRGVSPASNNAINNIGPALAAQLYGNSTIEGNLNSKQLSEFILPAFTIIESIGLAST